MAEPPEPTAGGDVCVTQTNRSSFLQEAWKNTQNIGFSAASAVIYWESIDLPARAGKLTHPNYPLLQPLNHQNQNK